MSKFAASALIAASVLATRQMFSADGDRQTFAEAPVQASGTEVTPTPAPAPQRKTIEQLREEYNQLETASRQLLDSTNGRDLSDEEKTADDQRFAKMKAIKDLIERKGRLASEAFAAPTPATVNTGSEPAGRDVQEQIEISVRDRFDGSKKFNRELFAKLVNEWARTGNVSQQFATITTATNSSALLPVDVTAPIIPSAQNVFREALSVYGLSAWNTPGTTRQINLPIVNASAGGVVSETANSETENAPGFSETIKSNPDTYQSGSVWFSMKEMMAVDFDLFSSTLPSLVYSKELGIESVAMTAIIADAGITQTVATATTSGFTYANLVSLNRKLPKRYNGQKVIILSKNAYSAAENLTTTTGYPILNADAQNQSLKRFNGTPVLWSDYLQDFGASNVVGIVFSHIGLRLRDCGQEYIQRFTQNQARPGQQGYNLYGFHSLNYAAPAIATLKCPIS